METIKKNLASLIKVKTIVTMVVIAVFAVLWRHRPGQRHDYHLHGGVVLLRHPARENPDGKSHSITNPPPGHSDREGAKYVVAISLPISLSIFRISVP